MGASPPHFHLRRRSSARSWSRWPQIEEATAVAHRGGGRDSIRIENSVRALNPRLRVISLGAPAERVKTRTIYGVEPSTTRLGKARRKRLYSWTKSPETAPDSGAGLELGFERGVPVAINGVPLDLSELIESLSIIAGQHGVGRIASPNETGRQNPPLV